MKVKAKAKVEGVEGKEIVCDCGHGREDHIEFVGCRKCNCSLYSQKTLNRIRKN